MMGRSQLVSTLIFENHRDFTTAFFQSVPSGVECFVDLFYGVASEWNPLSVFFFFQKQSANPNKGKLFQFHKTISLKSLHRN